MVALSQSRRISVCPLLGSLERSRVVLTDGGQADDTPSPRPSGKQNKHEQTKLWSQRSTLCLRGVSLAEMKSRTTADPLSSDL